MAAENDPKKEAFTSSTSKEAYLPWHLFTYRIAWANLAMWATGLYVGYCYGGGFAYLLAIPVHLAFLFFFFLTADVLPMYCPGVYFTPWDDDERTAWYYEFVKLAAADQYGKGVDLGFNLYEGDYTRTPEQSQTAKFEFAWKQMGLQEGMRVLDIGCGFGDWLNWLKTTKNCHVMGINITHGQADVVEKRGIKCLRGRWQDFHKSEEFKANFGGQFDAVSAWDTIEHYIKGKDTFNVPLVTETYRSLFQFAHKCIDPKTKAGVFWTSTLHRARHGKRFFKVPEGWSSFAWNREAFKEWLNTYLMTITYSGAYPGQLEWSSLSHRAYPEFSLEKQFDKIEDYRMTSLVCKNHFGNFSFNWGSIRFWLALPILFVTHAHMYFIFFNQCRGETAWMWHVGGLGKKPTKDCPTMLLWQCYRRGIPDAPRQPLAALNAIRTPC